MKTLLDNIYMGGEMDVGEISVHCQSLHHNRRVCIVDTR